MQKCVFLRIFWLLTPLWDFQLCPRLIASSIFGSERMNWNWLLVSTGLQSFRGARTQNAKVKTILLQKFMSLGTFGPKDPYSIMNRPRTLENWILQVHPDSKAPFYVILSKKKLFKTITTWSIKYMLMQQKITLHGALLTNFVFITLNKYMK